MDVGGVEGDDAEGHQDDADQEDGENGQLCWARETFGEATVKKIFTDEKIKTERTGKNCDEASEIASKFEGQQAHRNESA